MTPPLHILWQDEHLVAVYKPAGWLVHRTGLDAGETRFVMQTLRDQLGQHVYPVHRLDKGTCGVLVMALHSDAARALSQAFEQHATHKRYLAMVRGWPPAEAEVDHPLRPDDAPPDAPVQDAHTRFSTQAHLSLPEASDPRFATTRASLVQAEPTTGRRHQIRRHLKHLAHPIIGDATHGKGPLNRWWAERLGQQRLWLHAWQLSLPHPVTGEWLQLHSGLVLPTTAQDMPQPARHATTPAAPPTADWQHLLTQRPWEWLPPARQAAGPATANAGTDNLAQPRAPATVLRASKAQQPITPTITPTITPPTTQPTTQPTALVHALPPPLTPPSLFADEDISATNILAAVRSPIIARKEHTAAGWFGQTDFSLCRQHVDADGDAREDSVFITVWKQWDFYLAVDNSERSRSWLGTALATLQGVLKRRTQSTGPWQHPPSRITSPVASPAAPCEAPLTVLYRPYHHGKPGDWQALLPPDAASPNASPPPHNAPAWLACQQAWQGVLDYVRKGTAQAHARYPLWTQLQAEITPARLQALTSVPLFTDHYNDWWDSEKNGFWAGKIWIGARQPCLHQGEPWGRAFKLSWKNGEDGPGDAPDDAHSAYQLDLDEAREGPPLIQMQYTQRQSESRSPLPPCAADHLARLLRLYRQAQTHIGSRSAALQAASPAANAPAVPLMATPPLPHNLPDTDVFGPEGMECSDLWQSSGQDYVRTARAHLLTTQNPVDSALPQGSARGQPTSATTEQATVQTSLQSPFHAADGTPILPEDPRTPLADRVLHLARAVHQHADLALSTRFRQRFAFAPDAFAAHAYRASQATGPALLLDDGRVIVRTMQAGQGQPQWWLLHGLQAKPLTSLHGAGRSPNRQCFARCDGAHITTHAGWSGPVIARFALPARHQGNGDIPPALGHAAGASAQACEELIPFNNGQRVLLRNTTGVYLLTPDAVQRLHPPAWHDDYEQDSTMLRRHMVHMALSANEQYIAVGDQDSAHIVLKAHAQAQALPQTNDQYHYQVLAQYTPLSTYPCHATFTPDSAALLASACHLYMGNTGITPLGTQGAPMQATQALQAIQTQSRVEASTTQAGLVVLGDANGTLHGLDDTGRPLWHHHIGGAITSIDLANDGGTLIATSHSGYLVVLQRLETGPDPYAIGNSDYAEVGRWIFWRDEAAPLHW